MGALDDAFVKSAQKKPVEYEHGTNVIVFTPVDITAQFDRVPSHAELEVSLEGSVVGYITSFHPDERGVVRAGELGSQKPEKFHTVEGALEYLLPGAADKLDEQPQL